MAATFDIAAIFIIISMGRQKHNGVTVTRCAAA